MKNIFLFLFLISLLNNLYSFRIADDELKDIKEINFINYQGKYNKILTEDQIRNIGKNLTDNKILRMYNMSFYLKRIISTNEMDKLSGDIIGLGNDAKIDHIRNIQRIISSYIEKEFKYNRNEADTLAKFITYYNAIHRNDENYIKLKYAKEVLKSLKRNSIGISINYKDWPGKTEILIPLVPDLLAKKEKIDTTSITEKKVIEQVKKQEDKGVEDRKEMVKIKEKEVTETKKNIEEVKKDIQTKKQEIEKQQDEVKKEKQVITEKKQEVEKKIEEINKQTQNDEDKKTKIEELNKEKQKLIEEEKKIETKEKEIETKKEEIQKKEEIIKKEELKIEQKEQEIKQEKEEIKKDELVNEIKKDPEKAVSKIIEKEKELNKIEDELKQSKTDSTIQAGKFYYLKIKQYLPDGHYNNELYVLNALTRKIEKKSKINNICGSKYTTCSEGIIVITFKNVHTDIHNLTLLDLDNLDIKYQSKEDIFWRSFVELRDKYVFAIIKDNNNFYLGKFNLKMELEAKSKEKIKMDTFITFFADYIYVNGVDNNILVLDKNNLSLVESISP